MGLHSNGLRKVVRPIPGLSVWLATAPESRNKILAAFT